MKQFTLSVALALLGALPLWSQRTITGTVTDESGGLLVGVSIMAKGTNVGTQTNAEGKYTLTVPPNAEVLVFSYTGYRTEEIPIGSSNQLDVKMQESSAELTEIVVTGLGIRKEKKALGYGVTTLAPRDIALRPEADLARLIRGKATGVDIIQSSGMSGSGTNVIIRGYSSITGSNQPLFVVDGLPFGSETNADRNAREGGATASSRFLDIDPNNIAEINILKGLAATVLYGEAGRNGVILITTKTGKTGEAARDKGFEVNFTQSVYNTRVANLPKYQDTYGIGFAGNFGWFFSNWGPPFTTRGSNGIDANGQVAHPLDQAQYNDDFPEYIGVRYDYKPYKSMENFFQTGLINNTSVSVDKNFGNGNALSASYSYLYDEGIIPRDGNGNPTNFLDKHNFGLGGRAKLANGLSVRGTFNYVESKRQIPPAAVGFGSGPGYAGTTSLFSDVLYTPRSIDLLNLPYQSPIDGSMAYYRRGSPIQNPLWTRDNAKDAEDIRRFFGTITLDYHLTNWLLATYRLGLDQYTQQQRFSVNKGGSHIPNGTLTTSERLNKISDQVFNLLINKDLTSDFNLDALVGFNIRSEKRDLTFATSQQQFVFGLLTHNNFISHVNYSNKSLENTLGLYSTATLGFRNAIYLGIQARNDWTSTLERPNRSILYPSASLSVIPTELFRSLHGNTALNYLKLRAGYGTSAGYPDPYQTRSILSTATNVFVTSGGTVININSVDDRLGNPNLKPETHGEMELGLEGRFLRNRIGLDFSYYNKQSKDLIIDLDLDPSTGYTKTTVNAASIENKGVEIGLNLIPVKARRFVWDINLNFTRNINKVKSIAEGVDQVQIGPAIGSVANWAIPGERYGVIQGYPFLRHESGQRIVNAIGEYVSGEDIEIIGDPNPDYIANWLNSISWGGLTLSWHWQYIKGGDISSLTTATMLARGNTKDTDVDRELGYILPGVTADGNPNTTQGYLGSLMFNAYFFADEGTIFDATVIRLRDVALSYELPKSWLRKMPFGSASIRISGENMFFKAPNFPKYVNYDPEVLSTGVGNARGIENITGPTLKKYGIALNVTF